MENIVAGYSDFTGLAKLRVAAQKDQVKAAEEVGRQFEAFFIKSMLSSMRKASEPFKSDLWDSNALNSYEDMFDSELASSLSKAGGVGVTDWLVNQVLDKAPNGAESATKAIRLYQREAGAAIPLSGAMSG
jgi:flagellar protein FlgJ